MMKQYLFILGMILIGGNALAQDKIETDRPGETQSPALVPKKYFQAEIGVAKQNQTKEDYRLLLPTSLLKYGLSKFIELDLGVDYVSEYEQLIPNPKTTSGLAPVSVGTKIFITEEKGIIPQTSLLAHIKLPFASSKEFKPPHAAPAFRLAMQNSITKKVRIGYNLGTEWDGMDSVPQWIYTLDAEFDLGEKWEAFIEGYGSAKKRESPENSVDGGLSFYPSKNTKIDFSAGFGLTEKADRSFVAIGFSFRLPTH